MKIHIAGTVNDSIVDGPGLRFTVFTQGCPHSCAGCHNPETHDPMGGKEADTDELCAAFLKNPLLSGITLSGGEPLLQPEACLLLAQAAKNAGLNVWLYSGYTLEEILQESDSARLALLQHCDVLVDGKFELNLRSLNLRFCGSSNQRLIDLPASLQKGAAVLWTPPVW